MHRNTVRLVLAGVAVFYVVVGGVWATNYLPLRKFYEQVEIANNVVLSSSGFEDSRSSKYNKANEYITNYAQSHPDVYVTEGRIHLYQSILLWGTVAMGVGASVLFLTRGRRPG